MKQMERLTEYNQKVRGYFYPYCFQEDTCAGLGCEKPNCRFSEKACKRLGQYEDTGLMPEEVQELKEELEKYRASGKVEKFKALKQKVEPKKDNNDGGRCKTCGTYNNFIINKLANPKGHPVIYCWNCGQAIDLT